MKTNICTAFNALLVLLLCMTVPSMGGGNAYAQSKISGGEQLQKRVSLQVTNAPVSKVFAQIEAKSGVHIIFNASEVDKLPPVTRSFNNMTISRVLDVCLANSNLSYSVVNKNIVIRAEGKSLERITVFGTILDENNLPLPGANVVLKGTNIGVSTDTKGNYSISFGRRPGKENVLLYSFIGMKPEERSVNGSSNLNVTLKNDSEIEEVVVNGFYTQSKSPFTGAYPIRFSGSKFSSLIISLLKLNLNLSLLVFFSYILPFIVTYFSIGLDKIKYYQARAAGEVRSGRTFFTEKLMQNPHGYFKKCSNLVSEIVLEIQICVLNCTVSHTI